MATVALWDTQAQFMRPHTFLSNLSISYDDELRFERGRSTSGGGRGFERNFFLMMLSFKVLTDSTSSGHMVKFVPVSR